MHIIVPKNLLPHFDFEMMQETDPILGLDKEAFMRHIAPYVNRKNPKHSKHLNELFLKAAATGYTDKVELLLEQELVDINTKNSDKQNALMLACATGTYDTVIFLLESGIKKNEMDKNNYTAAHHAVTNYSILAFELLERYSADIRKSSFFGSNAVTTFYRMRDEVYKAAPWEQNLHKVHIHDYFMSGVEAISQNFNRLMPKTFLLKNDEEFTKYLNRLKFESKKERQKFLDQALTNACANNLLNKASILLQFGTKINIKIEYQTPLLYAIKKNNLPLVKLLVEHAAHLDKKIIFSYHVYEAMKAIVENEDIPLYLIEHLISHGEKIPSSSLHYACANGAILVIDRLIAMGWPLQGLDKEGNTPMLSAALNAKLNVIEKLVSLGCNKDAVNKDKKNVITALLVEISRSTNCENINKCTEIIEDLLLPRGFKISNYKEFGDRTLIHVAVLSDSLALVKKVLGWIGNKNIDATNKYGKTALQSAVEHGNLEIVEILIKEGAAINTSQLHAQEAFNIAIDKGHLEIAHYLLDVICEISDHNQELTQAQKFQLYRSNEKAKQMLNHYYKAVMKSGRYSNALIDACLAANKMIIEFLINSGAEFKSNFTIPDKNIYLDPPFLYIMQISYILPEAAEQIAEQIIESLKLFIDAGADLNFVSTHHHTLLTLLGGRSDIDISIKKKITKFLLDKGANPNIGTSRGEYPMHFFKDEALKNLLREYGALEVGANIQDLLTNAQSVHRAPVEMAVNKSLEALSKKQYLLPQDIFSIIERYIKKHIASGQTIKASTINADGKITSFKYNLKKSALESLERVTKSAYERNTGTQKFNFKQLLSMLWAVAEDVKSLPPSDHEDHITLEELVKDRQISIIKALAISQNEYSVNHPACEPGTFSMLVASLSNKCAEIQVYNDQLETTGIPTFDLPTISAYMYPILWSIYNDPNTNKEVHENMENWQVAVLPKDWSKAHRMTLGIVKSWVRNNAAKIFQKTDKLKETELAFIDQAFYKAVFYKDFELGHYLLSENLLPSVAKNTLIEKASKILKINQEAIYEVGDILPSLLAGSIIAQIIDLQQIKYRLAAEFLESIKKQFIMPSLDPEEYHAVVVTGSDERNFLVEISFEDFESEKDMIIIHSSHILSSRANGVNSDKNINSAMLGELPAKEFEC